MSKATVMITGVRTRQITEQGLPILTRKEIEIIALASLGLTADEIAKVLFISTRTVNFHMANLFKCVCPGRLVRLLNLLGTWTPHDPVLADKVAEYKQKLSL